MTLSEIVNNIIDTGYHLPSDDLDLGFRQVKFWVNMYRARLIKEYYEKRNYMDPINIQDAGCVELECKKLNECCNLDLDVPILRSVKKLPAFLDLPFGHAYTNINLIDKLTPLSIYDPSNIYWSRYNKYTKFTRKAFFIDNYLHVTSNNVKDNIRYVNMRGLFQDPEELKEFKQCGSEASCFDDSSPYPIPAHMVQILTELIMKNELKLYIGTTQLNDNTNDSAESQRQAQVNK